MSIQNLINNSKKQRGIGVIRSAALTLNHKNAYVKMGRESYVACAIKWRQGGSRELIYGMGGGQNLDNIKIKF